MAGVGTKLVFEDERIKIWELFLEPGEKTGLHTHTRDYYFYVASGGTLEVLDKDDKSCVQAEVATGEVVSFQIKDGELFDVEGKPVGVPATHWARNIGDTTYREILVEVKE